MAKKRRRRSGRPGAARSGGSQGPSGDERTAPAASRQQNRPRADRQARKQQARQEREAAMRAQRRRDTIRRFLVSVVVAAAVVGAFLVLTRVGGPNPFPEAAVEAATAANCSDVRSPAGADAAGGHLESGQAFTYDEEPATSGVHDPSPLSAEVPVYTEMPAETMLVHNLEHAFVNIYYRPDGPSALPQDVVDELTQVAEGDTRDHVILSPHTSLPDGADFAVTAWNKLLTCPSTVTATQARTIAQGFMTAYECTSNAPEPKQSDGC